MANIVFSPGLFTEYRYFMENLLLPLLRVLSFGTVSAQPDQATIAGGVDSTKLAVNRENFIINGMNWVHYPSGRNYESSLWGQGGAVVMQQLKTYYDK